MGLLDNDKVKIIEPVKYFAILKNLLSYFQSVLENVLDLVHINTLIGSTNDSDEKVEKDNENNYIVYSPYDPK